MTGWPYGRARDGGIDEIPLPGPGRLWLCGKHVVGPDPVGAMSRVGATTIVCLTEEHELADRYPAYVEWMRGSEQALWVPIHDLHAPELEKARALVGLLRTRLDAGEHLLMHCGAGIGRAGTIAVAVLMSYGVALEAALATVAAARPMAGPEAGAQRSLLEAVDSSWGSSGGG